MKREQENSLIIQAQQGDDRAFGELVNEFRGFICGYARRMTGNMDDAEDIAQMTFIDAWSNIRKFDLEKPAPFPAWLCGIARNKFLHFCRDRRGSAEIARTYIGTEYLNNLADGNDIPDASIIRREEAAIQDATVKKVLYYANGLNQSQNLVFRLRYLEGRKTENIQNITGFTVSSIHNRSYRAIENIRKHMHINIL
jgi:RNA polymerase sigma-70 factor (ECF subfamily)